MVFIEHDCRMTMSRTPWFYEPEIIVTIIPRSQGFSKNLIIMLTRNPIHMSLGTWFPHDYCPWFTGWSLGTRFQRLTRNLIQQLTGNRFQQLTGSTFPITHVSNGSTFPINFISKHRQLPIHWKFIELLGIILFGALSESTTTLCIYWQWYCRCLIDSEINHI